MTGLPPSATRDTEMVGLAAVTTTMLPSPPPDCNSAAGEVALVAEAGVSPPLTYRQELCGWGW